MIESYQKFIIIKRNCNNQQIIQYLKNNNYWFNESIWTATSQYDHILLFYNNKNFGNQLKTITHFDYNIKPDIVLKLFCQSVSKSHIDNIKLYYVNGQNMYILDSFKNLNDYFVNSLKSISYNPNIHFILWITTDIHNKYINYLVQSKLLIDRKSKKKKYTQQTSQNVNTLGSFGTQPTSNTIGTFGQQQHRNSFSTFGTQPTSNTIGTFGQQQHRNSFSTFGTQPTSNTIGTFGTQPTSNTIGTFGQQQHRNSFSTFGTQQQPTSNFGMLGNTSQQQPNNILGTFGNNTTQHINSFSTLGNTNTIWKNK